MTFEITRPETEARIRRYLRSGQFHDLYELLTRAPDRPGFDRCMR